MPKLLIQLRIKLNVKSEMPVLIILFLAPWKSHSLSMDVNRRWTRYPVINKSKIKLKNRVVNGNELHVPALYNLHHISDFWKKKHQNRTNSSSLFFPFGVMGMVFTLQQGAGVIEMLTKVSGVCARYTSSPHPHWLSPSSSHRNRARESSLNNAKWP